LELGAVLSSWLLPKADVPLLSRSSPCGDLYNLAAFSYQDYRGEVDEEAVLDDSWQVAESASERGWIGDLPEVAIENVVAFVGFVGHALGVLP